MTIEQWLNDAARAREMGDLEQESFILRCAITAKAHARLSDIEIISRTAISLLEERLREITDYLP